MKFILCSVLLIMSQSVSASLSKEEATLLYELNQKTFNAKELSLNYALCSFQNDLAETAGKEKLHCTQRNEGSNTESGDLKVQQTLNQVDGMTVSSISDSTVKAFSQNTKLTEKSEFDAMMDDAIKKMKMDFP